MSAPIGNNNNVNPIQTPLTGASSSATIGELGEHSVSVTIPVDAQAGTTTVNTVVTEGLVDVAASTSSDSGTVPITAKVTTSASGDSQLQETSETTQQATGGIFGRTQETVKDSSIDSSSSDEVLFNTESGKMRETGAAGEIKTESGKLPELAIPPYNPKEPASLLELMRNPTVQGQMKQKCGHYIWPDPSRGTFVFIPNGDYSKIQSVKVCNAKTNQPLANPKDVEKWVCKFAFAYGNMREDWETKRSSAIRQRTGLGEDTPVEYTNFVLNSKFKMATAYGPFNTKESQGNYTPSAWRRGTKVSVPKETWQDVGGWDPLGTIPEVPESIEFTNEALPVGGSSGPTPSGGFVIPPINVNVNLGGITTNVNTTGGSTTVSTTESPGSTKDTSAADDDISDAESSSDVEEINISYAEQGSGEPNMAAADGKNVTTSTASSQAEETTVSSKIPSLSLPEESLSNPFTAPAREVASALSNVLSSASRRTTSGRTTPQQGPESNSGPELLKKIRAHLDKAFTSQGTLKPEYRDRANIAEIITQHEQGGQDGIYHAELVSVYDPLENFDFGTEDTTASISDRRTMMASINNVTSTLTNMLENINQSITTTEPATTIPLPRTATYMASSVPLTMVADRIDNITESQSLLNSRPWDTGGGGGTDLANIKSIETAASQVTQALDNLLKELNLE
ncbi:MAG: hypothetical protein RR796_01640 [Victivallaceae bacterium]